MNGILVVDKPEGLTSAEVVRRVKRRVRVKVGHLGTLDPFATGVLPLCLGEATKIAPFLSVADKDYEGVIRLGVATDTGDRTGAVVKNAPVPSVDAEQLEQIAGRFVGAYEQVPPMYSALKRDGVPLYKLARQGLEVARPKRVVQIASFCLVAGGRDELRFAVSCSKGTYVRVLAEDVGMALGTVAHLAELRRTRFGPFGLSYAVNLASWDGADDSRLISLRAALAGFPLFQIDERAALAVRRGQAWVLSRLPDTGAAAALLIDPDDRPVAIVERRDGRWSFGRVLAG